MLSSTPIDSRGFGLIPELILVAVLFVALGFAAYLDFHKVPAPPPKPTAILPGADCSPQEIPGQIVLTLPPETSASTIETLIAPIHGTILNPPGEYPRLDTVVAIKVPNADLNADIEYLQKQPTVQGAGQNSTVCPA